MDEHALLFRLVRHYNKSKRSSVICRLLLIDGDGLDGEGVLAIFFFLIVAFGVFSIFNEVFFLQFRFMIFASCCVYLGGFFCLLSNTIRHKLAFLDPNDEYPIDMKIKLYQMHVFSKAIESQPEGDPLAVQMAYEAIYSEKATEEFGKAFILIMVTFFLGTISAIVGGFYNALYSELFSTDGMTISTFVLTIIPVIIIGVYFVPLAVFGNVFKTKHEKRCELLQFLRYYINSYS